MRAAKPALRLRTSIPIATGTRMIAKTLTTSPNGTETSSPRS